jgi:hypothetical protein
MASLAFSSMIYDGYPSFVKVDADRVWAVAGAFQTQPDRLSDSFVRPNQSCLLEP